VFSISPLKWCFAITILCPVCRTTAGQVKIGILQSVALTRNNSKYLIYLIPPYIKNMHSYGYLQLYNIGALSKLLSHRVRSILERQTQRRSSTRKLVLAFLELCYRVDGVFRTA
jgi:hypothetical protein